MKGKSIRIGTRGSNLALYQANRVKMAIENSFPDVSAGIVIIQTKGDKILDVSLSKIGDKGLFTKELEYALLDNRIDVAVHSLKDLPTIFPDGLRLGAVLERSEVRDALVSRGGKTLRELGKGDTIATSSLRRRAQLLSYNPGFNIIDIRGNVNTRLAKIDNGYCEAMIMAATALQRLGLDERITEILDTEIMIPAVSQGAIAVEVRDNDHVINDIMDAIHHRMTGIITNAERVFLKSMDGGCQIPVGCFTTVNNGTLTFTGFLIDLEGTRPMRVTVAGELNEADTIALSVSDRMMEMGAKEILDEIRSSQDG